MLEDLLKVLHPSWQADALCKEYPGVSWFPERGEPGARARAICARCAVASECAAFALANDEVGIWGGTTGLDRRRLTAGQPRRQAPRPPCGTEAGYYAHRRYGEVTCDDCREARRRSRTRVA